MKTAMQELIDEIVECLTYDDDLIDEARNALEKIRIKCICKLELEKEQLHKTWKASEQNMRSQFSSSVYKNVTFEEWLETI